MGESAEARMKRLAMRSGRRGIKEMDLILGAYARDRLAAMDEDALQLYDAMLSENDQDLYLWVTGQATPPHRFAGLIADIAAHARAA
ncbi:MAG: succinate dehydrogenase assembly factor 2 [Rhodobacter sp.]|nr:succinate dehydrogenase assembly factor 2 [Rhodobacter sp.]